MVWSSAPRRQEMLAAMERDVGPATVTDERLSAHGQYVGLRTRGRRFGSVDERTRADVSAEGALSRVRNRA